MKKSIGILLVLALMFSLLAGCGSGAQKSADSETGTEKTAEQTNSETEQTDSEKSNDTGFTNVVVNENGDENGYDIVFWMYASATVDEQGECFNSWREEFLAQNPDVHSITFVPKSDDDLLTSLLAGVGLPNCFYASARNAQQFKNVINLLNLKPYWDAEPGYADGFYEDAINAVTDEDGIWACPFISYIPIIFRNLDVLEKAGIDPSEPVETYDDLIAQFEKVQAAGIQPTHSWTTGSYYCPGAVMASDGDNINVGEKDGKTTIEASSLVRTFETLNKIAPYTNGMVYGLDATIQAFNTGELGYLLDGPWTEPTIQHAGTNYDAILVPAYEPGGRTGGLQGWDWFYGVDSGDEGLNDAIARWLMFIDNKENNKDWMIKIGRPVLREDVMNDPDVMVTMISKVNVKGLEGGMMQMDFGHSTVFWASAIADVAPRCESGEITPEEAAEEMVAAVNGLIAEAGE